MRAPESDARSSRDAIKMELSGKIDYNHFTVFSRLGVEQVPDALVEACAAFIRNDPTIHNAKQALQTIVANGTKKPNGGVEKKTERDEKKMYPHMKILLSSIEQFSLHGLPRKFDRQLLPTAALRLTTDGDTWSFPRNSPDFTMLDISEECPRVLPSQSDDEQPRSWRHRSAWAELKVTEAQGPLPSDPKIIKEIVTQSADYARLHISARPFQLFSVGLLAFGSKFCVAIYDRDGGQFSPYYDLWDDLEVFIRVIRRMTCDMSPVELGQDPTVSVLPHGEALLYQARAQSLNLQAVPTYVIEMGQGGHRWYTLGPPIWSSLSLLGRGTSVWRVCDPSSPKKLFVLKNAWRHSERLPESKIYESIIGAHPGVAGYTFGGDVVFPGGGGRLISVKRLRDLASTDDSNTPILHRLLIATIGRPLWHCTSELELLKGLRAALKGHKFLSDQGILHRDISAGNILLSTAGQPLDGHEGFLMDIEYAHNAHSFVDEQVKSTVDVIRGPGGFMTEPMTRTHRKFGTLSVKRGAIMTGTVQFMALEILRAIFLQRPITHEIHHDLESFIWVLCYSLDRWWIASNAHGLSGERLKALTAAFYADFGRMDINTVWSRRSALVSPLSRIDTFPELSCGSSAPLGLLYSKLLDILYDAQKRQLPGSDSANTLTYDLLFDALDQGIQGLSG